MSIESSEIAWRQACVASLAGLPGMGPSRLAALLADAPPEVAWSNIASGRPMSAALRAVCGKEFEDLIKSWRREMRHIEPLDVLERYHARNISVWSQLDDYPAALMNDPWAPGVLFWQGDARALDKPAVAIIGTRHCSNEGRETARRFARELSEAGIAVVSGLALGIDGAAHTGALEAHNGAAPIAVVGNGLDSIYPRRNAHLWREVIERGLLVSESPLGAKPDRWRFPARNRIIAGLSRAVVVVESHERGGSLLTVEEAVRRDVTVLAVPGSINAPASRGTNALLAEGCAPVCSTDDILTALSWQTCPNPWPVDVIEQQQLFDDDQIVLDAVDWSPTSTDDILLKTGQSLGQVAAALHRLREGGWLFDDGGWWRRAPT